MSWAKYNPINLIVLLFFFGNEIQSSSDKNSLNSIFLSSPKTAGTNRFDPMKLVFLFHFCLAKHFEWLK